MIMEYQSGAEFDQHGLRDSPFPAEGVIHGYIIPSSGPGGANQPSHQVPLPDIITALIPSMILLACQYLSGLPTTPTAPTRPQMIMEKMGEFSPILPLLINSMTTTSSNHFRSARIRQFTTGIAATNTAGSRFMAELQFSLPRGVDHRIRLGCLRWSFLIRGHPIIQKN